MTMILSGPAAFGDFLPLNAPPAADVYAVTMSDGRLLAGTGGGVYASDDSGKSWYYSNEGMTASDTICAFSVRGSTVWAGVVRDTGGRLFRSRDAGMTWMELRAPLGTGTIISITPLGSQLILAAVGIWISTDDGDSWQARDSGLCPSVCSFAALIDSTNDNAAVLFASTDLRYTPDGSRFQCGGGIWRSLDTGRSWQLVTGAPDSALRSAWYVLYANHGKVIGSLNYSSVGGVIPQYSTYGTTDLGNTWSTSQWGLVKTTCFAMAGIQDTLYASTCGAGIFQSTNNGHIWSSVGGGPPGQPDALWAGHGVVVAGISQLPVTYFYGTQTTNRGGSYGCDGETVEMGVYYSTDLGQSWGAPISSVRAPCEINILDIRLVGGTIFCALGHGGNFESRDNGKTWVRDFSGLIGGSGMSGGDAIYNLWNTRQPSGLESIFGNFPSGGVQREWLWKRNLPDTTWAPSDNGVPSNGRVLGFLQDTAVVVSGSFPLFAGFGIHGIYLSTDNGESWIASDSSIGQANFITVIPAQPPLLPRTLFASTFTGLYFSTNEGITWHKDLGFTYHFIYQVPLYTFGDRMFLIVDSLLLASHDGTFFDTVKVPAGFKVTRFEGAGRVLFGLGSPGVIVSGDSGRTWREESLGDSTLGSESVALVDSLVYLGTTSRGIWVQPYSAYATLTDVHEEGAVPSSSAIINNYPDPSSSQIVNVDLMLPHTGPTSVGVYTTLGERVAELQHGTMPAGEYHLKWETTNIPAGVYFIKVETGAVAATKMQMVLR